MKKDEKIFLKHMLESIELITKFTKDLSKEDFLDNPLVQEGVMRRIEIMGEAVKNIPKSFRDNHPEIEWRKIAGTRDVLIHDYLGTDLDLVWDIVKRDIPDLKKKIRNILDEMETISE